MVPGGGTGAIGQWISRFDHPTTPVYPPAPSWSGSWPSTFEAINLAVIPGVTNNPGDIVIAWDNEWYPPHTAGAWEQRFTIGDPEVPSSFQNYVVSIPNGPMGAFYGSMFCAGQAWLPDGRLFVAGGTTQYAQGTYNWAGSQFVAFWDPQAPRTQANNYGWDFTLLTGASSAPPKPMRLMRWYPTVTLISPRYVMVSGGTSLGGIANDPASRTYEVFDLQVGDWIREPATPSNPNPPNKLFDGPTTLTGNPPQPTPSPELAQYPRLHLLSNHRVFLSGGWQESAYVTAAADPNNYSWTNAISSNSARDGGSSVLVPNVGRTGAGQDEIMVIGGGHGTVVESLTQRIAAGSASPQWGGNQTMHSARMVGNAVLAPNGDIVMIGGSSDYYFSNPPVSAHIPVTMTEVWDKVNGWTRDAEQSSPRMYHSTAALLPSGRMVSAGSDVRTYDWEVYEPRYMANGQAVPEFAGTWANPGYVVLNWGTEYQIGYAELPIGVAIGRVVLMRPCSTTHHSDMDQRYVELKLLESTVDGEVRAVTPTIPGATSVVALPGWYMMFLVTTEGCPSRAKWVKLP